MGQKGDNLTEDAMQATKLLTQRLSPLGDITSRKMFGGYGIFESKVMFALVNSRGEAFLKVGEANRERFRNADCTSHGKMPYFSVPAPILGNDKHLREWAHTSIVVAKGAKK